MFTASAFRWSILVVLAALGGMIAYYMLRPGNIEFQAKSISVLKTDADLQIDKLHVVQNKKGDMEWELWADVAKVYREKNITRLENLRLQVYPRSGKRMTLTADKGQMENKTRNIQVRGNVVVYSSDGYTLRTQSLRFNSKTKQFETNDPIELDSKEFKLSGVGLSGNAEAGRILLREKVRAVIQDLGKRGEMARRGLAPPRETRTQAAGGRRR